MQGKKLKFKQKYKQLQRLGQGKMGIVYKVEKRPNVAVQSSPSTKSKGIEPKFYAAKHISLNKIDLQMAKKQLKILQQLKHMYIVRFYEDFIQNEELILIMDYCEGKDLQYHINQMKTKGKYFNQSVVSTWIFQLILVIQYIHSCHIVHRDIKPQNIFVDIDMNLKIGDFGVSKLLDGSQNCQTMIGTPLYFSPQLTRNQPYSRKTDIWSLGCVIYQICTLEKPFKTSKGMFDLINKIQTSQPKNIPTLYSNDLNKLIQKMLIKDAKKRPSSRQLLQDPILVQLMINYSSQINLKAEYQNNPLQKPSMTDSFIENQVQNVNDRLLKFQQQVKQKMESMKNKKVKTSQIDKYYADIQNKMKGLQKIVDSAFKQLKHKSQPDSQQNIKTNSKLTTNQSQTYKGNKVNSKSNLPTNNNSFNKNRSDFSESDVTIKSINLGATNKLNKNQQKQVQSRILDFNQSSSIESVNSVFVKTNNKSMNDSLGVSSNKFGKSSSLSNTQNSNLFKKKEQPQDLSMTLKSQFVQTIKKVDDVNQVKDKTLNHLEQLAKSIQNNPNLILDDSFLDATLSMSNNDQNLMVNNFKKKKPDLQTSIGKSCSSSGRTINFELSKKEYPQNFNLSKKTETLTIKSQGQKDSLDEQYQEDFDSYEQDKQIDVRQQQRRIVQQLFSKTLKSLTSIKNDSSASSLSNNSMRPKDKYAASLSTIRQQSSQGGSTISFQQDI